jgi:hypothetical protein
MMQRDRRIMNDSELEIAKLARLATLEGWLVFILAEQAQECDIRHPKEFIVRVPALLPPRGCARSLSILTPCVVHPRRMSSTSALRPDKP